MGVRIFAVQRRLAEGRPQIRAICARLGRHQLQDDRDRFRVERFPVQRLAARLPGGGGR
jgi:hypothetical protein